MSHNPNPYYNPNSGPNNNAGYNAGPHAPYQQNIIMVNQKSALLAYVLWLFTGGFGGHKFYLGQTTQGFCYLGLTIIGWLTSFIGIGFLFLGVLLIALLIDLFIIPARVDKVNRGYISNTLNLFD